MLTIVGRGTGGVFCRDRPPGKYRIKPRLAKLTPDSTRVYGGHCTSARQHEEEIRRPDL